MRNGAWTAVVANKLTGPTGQFFGLLLINIELRHFENFFASTILDTDVSVALVNTTGTLLARHPAADSAIGRNVTSAGLGPVLDSNAAQSHMRFKSPMDGQARLASLHHLRHAPTWWSSRPRAYRARSETGCSRRHS
jgi:hypothetical protein